METPDDCTFFQDRSVVKLRKQLVDRRPERQNGNGTTTMIEVILVEVDAEMPIHRGQDILRLHGAFLGFGAFRIGFTDDPPALDASTGYGSAENVRIVVGT